MTASTRRSLAEHPFPRALAELALDRATGTLRLRHTNLEKTILLVDGTPVSATSNIAEERLGRFLVRRGEVSEEVAHEALARAINAGRRLGEVLVEMKALSPYDLFRALQRSTGAAILDAFRWDEGEITFEPGAVNLDATLKLKVDPAQLVLRGVASYSPFSQVEADFRHGPDLPLGLLSGALEAASFNLSALESRLARSLAEPRSVRQLAMEGRVTEEVAWRFLYALVLLRVAGTAEEMHEAARVAANAAEKAAEQVDLTDLATPMARSLSTEEKERIDAAYLLAKGGDFFALLGVQREPGAAEIRRSFLELCEQFSPVLFKAYELGDYGDRIEELFFMLVRAYSTLADPGTRAVHRRTLESRRKTPTQPPQAVENPFAIKTDLLDTGVHVENGKRELKAQNTRQALRHFEFAIDLNANDAAAQAYLGFCKFSIDPESFYVEAMEHLKRATGLDASLAEPHYFTGRMLEFNDQRNEALRAYERCRERDARHAGARAAIRRLQSKR